MEDRVGLDDGSCAFMADLGGTRYFTKSIGKGTRRPGSASAFENGWNEQRGNHGLRTHAHANTHTQTQTHTYAIWRAARAALIVSATG